MAYKTNSTNTSAQPYQIRRKKNSTASIKRFTSYKFAEIDRIRQTSVLKKSNTHTYFFTVVVTKQYLHSVSNWSNRSGSDKERFVDRFCAR